MSMHDTKQGAIAQARQSICAVSGMTMSRMYAVVEEALKKEEMAELQEMTERRTRYEVAHPVRAVVPKARMPKRRRAIFEKSGGQCHYCATPLTLDGKWHIEHKMPKALLGGDEPGNLVAACAPCNFKKRDRTDVEFIALRTVANA